MGGANQDAVWHAGQVGPDGGWLRDRLRHEGVDTAWLATADEIPTGHALLQVDRQSENAIVLFPGANRQLRPELMNRVLDQFGPGDWLVLQNEVNGVGDLIAAGGRRGLTVVFNAAPCTAEVGGWPLEQVRYLIVNETEGAALSGKIAPEEIIAELRRRYPRTAVVLTLGRDGVAYADADGVVREPARVVVCVDTTAAGDTFVGYFLSEMLRGAAPRRRCA